MEHVEVNLKFLIEIILPPVKIPEGVKVFCLA